jgi:hypothetical protein
VNQNLSFVRWGERGSTTIQYIGLTAATAALLVVLVFTMQSRGGVVAQSLVEVFQCNILSFVGQGSCGSPAATPAVVISQDVPLQVIAAQAAPNNVWDSITSTLSDWWNQFTNWWNNLPTWGKVLVVVGAIVVVVLAVIAAVKLGIVAAIGAALKAIGLALKAAVVWVARTALPAIGRWLAQVAWPAIVAAAKAVASRIASLVTRAATAIASLIARAATAIASAVRAVVNAIVNTVKAIAQRLWSLLVQGYRNFVEKLAENLTKIGVNVALSVILDLLAGRPITVWTFLAPIIAYGIAGLFSTRGLGTIGIVLITALIEIFKKLVPMFNPFNPSTPAPSPTPAPTPTPSPMPTPTPSPTVPTPNPTVPPNPNMPSTNPTVPPTTQPVPQPTP